MKHRWYFGVALLRQKVAKAFLNHNLVVTASANAIRNSGVHSFIKTKKKHVHEL